VFSLIIILLIVIFFLNNIYKQGFLLFLMKKGLVIIVLLTLLFIPAVISQTIVEVPQEQPQQTNYFEGAFSFLKSKVILTIIIILVVVIAFLVGAFFLVRWLVTFLKKRNDIFYKVRKERIKLASTQRRYPAKHWYKVHKNTPIRLVRKEGERLIISSPIGYYKGDYITHEGNFILSMNIIGYKFWWFFPTTEILIIPNREKVITKNPDSKKSETAILPLAKNVVQFNENEVLLFAESISNTGMFFVPVMKSKDGRVIDLTLPTYDSLKNVVLGDYLYEQTTSFSQLAKKSMDINPYIRSAMKVADTSQSVEIPSQQERR